MERAEHDAPIRTVVRLVDGGKLVGVMVFDPVPWWQRLTIERDADSPLIVRPTTDAGSGDAGS